MSTNQRQARRRYKHHEQARMREQRQAFRRDKLSQCLRAEPANRVKAARAERAIDPEPARRHATALLVHPQHIARAVNSDRNGYGGSAFLKLFQQAEALWCHGMLAERAERLWVPIQEHVEMLLSGEQAVDWREFYPHLLHADALEDVGQSKVWGKCLRDMTAEERAYYRDLLERQAMKSLRGVRKIDRFERARRQA